MSIENSIEELKEGKYIHSFDDTLKQLLEEKEDIPFFKTLKDEEIKLLLKNVMMTQFFSNQIIFKENEEGDSTIYYLLDGYVNVVKKSDMFMNKISKLEAGVLFGEMRHLLSEPRSATCMAGKDGAVAIGFEINENIDSNISEKLYKNISEDLLKKIKAYDINFNMNESINDENIPDYYKKLSYKLANTIKEHNIETLIIC